MYEAIQLFTTASAYAIQKEHVAGKLSKGFYAPILTIHGMLDEHVSIEHSYRLENALHGHVQSWYYPHFSHHFPLKDQQRILTEGGTFYTLKLN